ncbi:MAG TPA: hypothetical protein DDZ96_11825 [Porphyromonadaceae bacterium]|jgi:hypothetical protein|uniref:hypothetical protein n=1 Tax=Limibacterium fermenti TaxID=3229863 RepID=UPI000E942FA6|nr:hypothetical protein [Porphyromonadaceae bacterium]HBK31566.1 hypothetical protein [Porphyromonadaceae bacterium]HBL34487.1 hypothetical protein [Porphyromonadaceae bacterium]HBX21163.1 hypothetical protein [Porphyromonadaceae bacterium]HBX46096.1 hypothetical protein [Porphyromonadaceae bacterium]
MATIVIDLEGGNDQADKLIEYIKTLPYATVIEEKKKNFQEAAEACHAIPVDEFIDELRSRVKAHFNHA